MEAGQSDTTIPQPSCVPGNCVRLHAYLTPNPNPKGHERTLHIIVWGKFCMAIARNVARLHVSLQNIAGCCSLKVSAKFYKAQFRREEEAGQTGVREQILILR